MLATIIICLVLACIVGAIIANMIKKHKNGASACGLRLQELFHVKCLPYPVKK